MAESSASIDRRRSDIVHADVTTKTTHQLVDATNTSRQNDASSIRAESLRPNSVRRRVELKEVHLDAKSKRYSTDTVRECPDATVSSVERRRFQASLRIGTVPIVELRCANTPPIHSPTITSVLVPDFRQYWNPE